MPAAVLSVRRVVLVLALVLLALLGHLPDRLAVACGSREQGQYVIDGHR